ncbi:MAG: MoxR family ATPase [Bacillota bacterium]
MIFVEAAAFASKVQENIARVIVGRRDVIEKMMAALIARGHVLLEDVPGTGKTMLSKALAKSLRCVFTRIQFTPDLMPSDITGSSVFKPSTGEFEFRPGPVFTNILLADEINRATPRTQAALLECMEERQVTEGGVTRKLEEPFLVVATQNPVEIQGTFALPEAQLDRFLMRLSMGYPEGDEAVAVLNRFLTNDPMRALDAVATAQDLTQAQAACPKVQVSEPVMRYIAALCEHTRRGKQVLLGASPRGMLALMRASQALAIIRGRDFVIPDDVKALAVPVLAHRVIVRGVYGKTDAGREVILDALHTVPVPTEEPGA